MSDAIDITNRRILQRESLLNKDRVDHPYEIPPGVAGVCEHCEQESPRLINNACARCRDEYHLD